MKFPKAQQTLPSPITRLTSPKLNRSSLGSDKSPARQSRYGEGALRGILVNANNVGKGGQNRF